MKILAIETSCDETAIAIADFSGTKTHPSIQILSNVVSSQVKLHAEYGGVVPNLARREHQRNLPTILISALKESKLPQVSKQIPNSKLKELEIILKKESELFDQFTKNIMALPLPDIDAIAVTHGPGLAPALWVGVNFARALAMLWDKPLIPVNHMEGHLYSALLKITQSKLKVKNQKLKSELENIEFPALALLVSGGHTELVLVKKLSKYEIIGETLDDAVGEAFDKVARMLDLGYPGGPKIAAAAELTDKNQKLKIKLPRPMLNSKDYNFSFSGLKTAVLYLIRDLQKKKISITKMRPNIAKEFQDAAVEVLVKKTIRAVKEFNIKTLLLGGGVAANAELRTKLGELLQKENPDATYLVPDPTLTGDNALMIALAAFLTGKKKAPIEVKAEANLRLG